MNRCPAGESNPGSLVESQPSLPLDERGMMNEGQYKGVVKALNKDQSASFNSYGFQWTMHRRCFFDRCGHHTITVLDRQCFFLHVANKRWKRPGKAGTSLWTRWDEMPSLPVLREELKRMAVEAIMVT